MNVHPDGSQDAPEIVTSRRTVLRTGAVGGALLWTVPIVQIVGVSAADAASEPPPPPPPGEPLPTEGYPSHGFALIDCGTGLFAVKVEGSDGSLGALGTGNDVTFLAVQKGLVLGVDYRQATAEDLAHLAGGGYTTFDPDGAGPTGTLPALFIALGPGCTFHDGYSYVFDGSFAGGGENCGDGDKFTSAVKSGSVVYFTVYCNEGSGGEN